jgi:hypothetical protein
MIYQSEFIDNSASINGGAIAISNYDNDNTISFKIINCKLNRNSAKKGGSIHIENT